MKARGQWFKLIVPGFFLLCLSLGLSLFAFQGKAAEFTMRQLKISSSKPAANGVTYELSFNSVTSGMVGSIRLQLCSNDPFPGSPCTPPTSLDFSGASLFAQSGMTGFSLSNLSSNNEIILTRTPSPGMTNVTSVYTIKNVTNPSGSLTIYGRLETFASADATGPSTDAAGLAIGLTPDDVSIQSYVPPYITFCIGANIQPYDCSTASGNYADFGVLSPTRTATAQTKLLAMTNAEFGYTVRVTGTTLASGTNVIPALATPDASRQGVSQFGMNLRANSTPGVGSDPQGPGAGQAAAAYNTPNMYAFNPGDVIISSTHPEDSHMFTASFITNVSKSQLPGIYVTTLTYIALGTF